MASLTLTVAALAIAAQIYLSPIPEVSTIGVLGVYFGANTILFTSLLLCTQNITSFLTQYFTLNTIFLITATTLTLIRRLYFSPLSHFPGPKLAAASKLWDANEYRLGRASVTHRSLHEKYGSDVVRIGPNEVSLRNVDAVEKIYRGKYVRGTFYEMGRLNGEFNLNTGRDYKFHGPWRRIWERAFSSAEFKDYNPRVEYHVSKLIEILKTKAAQGIEVNCSKLMDNLVFDIMADLSFANDAGMQSGSGDGSYMNFIHNFMFLVGIIGSLRNLSQLLIYLPESAEVRAYRTKGEAMLSARQKLGASRKDIFRHLLAEDSETGSKFTQEQLNANANLIIVAGADTTSSSLTQTFRTLATNERVLRKLQREIDGVGVELTAESTKGLVYLNAVVNEALRLLNPLPSGVQATTSPSGVEVDGTFVPGNVQVRVPHLVIMTDERYFPKPNEFIPERWTGERPELLLDRRAFIPFGYGVHSCVGKQLALNEMRLVLARVVSEFDVVYGESYDDAKFEEDWKDYAVLKIGDCFLKFVQREM